MKRLVTGFLVGLVLGTGSVGAAWIFTSRSDNMNSAERTRVIAYATTAGGTRSVRSTESLGDGLWRVHWTNGSCILFDMKHFVDGIPHPLDC